MPNRIIKESICYSDDLDKLTPFEETVFYRLLVRVDDYGRIDARIPFLKSMLFATKPGVTDKNIKEAVAKLASVGLVRLYEVDRKPFLLFPKWHLHQRVRDSKPKYPGPANEENFIEPPQVAASCGELRPESQSKSKSKSKVECEDALPDSFSPKMKEAFEEWLRYKSERRETYKPQGRRALISQIENHLKTYSEDTVISLIDECMANGWKGIIWDRLSKKPTKSDRQPTYDLNEVEQLMRDYVPSRG